MNQSSLRGAFDDGDFCGGEVVELVDELVYLVVGGGDLALQDGFFLRQTGGCGRSGLVMKIGGTLSHGAVVAREYGIPAVVGVRGATEKLHTGQRIRVDGNRGVIQVV